MMQTVLRLTTSPEFTEVRSAFTLWLNHLLLPRHQPELTNKLAQIEDLSETIAMTATTYRNWGQDLREAVRQEVRQESTVETLSMLITHKFGSLPDWATARLKQASQQDLNRWTLRILDVQRIEDVFH